MTEATANATHNSCQMTIPKDTIVSAKVWDIYSPPPTNTFKGTIIPKAIGKLNKRRRLSIEIHRVYTESSKAASSTAKKVSQAPPEAAPSSTIDPGTGIFKQATKALLSTTDVTVQDHFFEECVIRILTPSKSVKKAMKRNGHAADDDESVASSIGGDDTSTLAGDFRDTDNLGHLPSYAGWKAKYKLPIRAVTIKSAHRKDVVILAQHQTIKHTRDLIFDSEEEAAQFVRMVEAQKKAEERRAEIKIKHASGGKKFRHGEEITLLVEIVSGTDLPVADLKSSDPFVTCFLNGKEVHRTKFISKDLNPVWTLKTHSLFLVALPVKELFAGDGLLCEVSDFDKLGENEKLGAISVPPKTLYESKGERLSYPLRKAHGQPKDYKQGSLAIRVRHATANDKTFMAQIQASEKQSLTQQHLEKATKTLGGKSSIQSVVHKAQKYEKLPNGSRVKMYRTRPSPDPKRAEDTQWLTKRQIEAEIVKESTDWLDTGSGDAARLFVEILSCDGLPNLDTGGFLGNKTDAFVALVYEDTWAKTDVIDDCLSPRWLPWSRRAFIFHTAHSSSQLFLGVFDFDTGLDDHDLIGRVSVDVSGLRPNIVYTLTYNIYPTSRMTDRVAKGQVTVRLRMEVDDERKLLTSCIEPPKTMYVNVKKKKDFKVIQYSAVGKYDMESYSMKVITSYIDELTTYQNLLMYLQDAVIAVLFWRPQFDFPVGDKVYKLPIHSVNAFLMGIFLVERPQLIPSFFFASVSWLLLAIMFYRRHNPNPWRRCKSFLELLQALVLGSSGNVVAVEPFENATEAANYESVLRQRIEDAEKKALEAAKEAEEEAKLQAQEMEEIGETNNDISTKKGGPGISIDPFRPILEPIQGYLALTTRLVRYLRNILLWEECYIAFWVTVGCFILSVVCLFVPWFFLIQWTSRILVWTLLGPWMRLVDIHYYSKIENMTEEELQKAKEEAKTARRAATEAAVLEARIERENAKKLKAMKQYLFGKFIMKVPVLKDDRWRDVPLPQSKAEPHNPKNLGLAELAMKEAGYHRIRVPGQDLKGDMIPTIESKTFTDAPVGQATKEHAEIESNADAYVKIGGMVAGAGIITWFGVPFVASMAQSVLGG